MDITPLLRRAVEVVRVLLPVALVADTAHSLYTVHGLARSRLRECQQEEQEALVDEVVGTLRHAAQRCAAGQESRFWPAALNARLGLAPDAGDKASPASAAPFDGQDATCPLSDYTLFEALGVLPSCAPSHHHPADDSAHELRAPPEAAGPQAAAPEPRQAGGAGQGEPRVEVVLFTLQDAWDHCAALAQPEGVPSTGGGGGSSGGATPQRWTPAAVKARLMHWAAGAGSAAQDSIQSRLPSSELLLVRPSVVGHRSSEWLGIRWPPSKEGP